MNRLFIFLLLLILSGNLQAQTFIPRFGLTIAKTNAESEEGFNQKFNLGFTFGLGAEFSLNSNVSLQPELNFVQKGFRITMSESDQGFSMSVDSRASINYLELPVLLKLYLSEGETRFYGIVGPSIGVGVGGKIKSKVKFDFGGDSYSVTVSNKIKFGDPPPDYDPEEDSEVYFDNRLDFGIHGGFGVVVKDQFIIEARYNHGLSPLMDEEKKSKHRVIQLAAAIPWSTVQNLIKK
jgi:hypothetical protein